ncbi:hypothetical protein BDR06DRAFT_602742 [Suillus hirtellus]|nr:hypothetical protein BDR06DRAFT_602742 [Suillus hirtellus]
MQSLCSLHLRHFQSLSPIFIIYCSTLLHSPPGCPSALHLALSQYLPDLDTALLAATVTQLDTWTGTRSPSLQVLCCLDSQVVHPTVPFIRHTTHKSVSTFLQTWTTPSTSSDHHMFSSSMVQASDSANVAD